MSLQRTVRIRARAVARAEAPLATPLLSATGSAAVAGTEALTPSNAEIESAAVAQATSLALSHTTSGSDSETIALTASIPTSDATTVARRVVAARAVARTNQIAFRLHSRTGRLHRVGVDAGRLGVGRLRRLSRCGQSDDKHKRSRCNQLRLHRVTPFQVQSFVGSVDPSVKVVYSQTEKVTRNIILKCSIWQESDDCGKGAARTPASAAGMSIATLVRPRQQLCDRVRRLPYPSRGGLGLSGERPG
jgi:hypothetical protein